MLDFGLTGKVLVANKGYGVSGSFRKGLAGRSLQYVLDVTAEMLAEQPQRDGP
jgi:hypothetical protein